MATIEQATKTSDKKAKEKIANQKSNFGNSVFKVQHMKNKVEATVKRLSTKTSR